MVMFQEQPNEKGADLMPTLIPIHSFSSTPGPTEVYKDELTAVLSQSQARREPYLRQLVQYLHDPPHLST